MYLLYLDGSGGQDWPPPVGSSDTNHYVLAGLGIQNDSWLTAKNELDIIVERYFPDKSRRPKELKYADLRGGTKELGTGPYRKLTHEQRQQLTEDVFGLIIKLNPVLFAVVVDKIKHYMKYKTPEQVKQLSIRFMVPRYSKFLERVDDDGIMVYDAEEARSDLAMRSFLHQSRKNGIVLSADPNWDPSSIFTVQNRLEGIIESLFFIDSVQSPVIQLADFCAHAIFLNFERGYDTRFRQIEPLFDRVGDQVYGLIIWPKEG